MSAHKPAIRVRLGDRKIEESNLLHELERVQNAIQQWAKARDLWYDTRFAVPFRYYKGPPRSHETFLILSDGQMANVSFSDHDSEFFNLLERLGYWFESQDDTTLYFYPKDRRLRESFLRLHRWQWIQGLAEKRMVGLRAEVFEYFGRHPDDLYRIEWRKFEELLDAIFRNQGYHTELGPGTNDGGVDLRLYQDRAIPEIVTLVQAKRQLDPIKLDGVAALFGIAALERAPKALFATTSTFQPKARKWALCTESALNLPTVELADGSRIAGWCSEIGQILSDYFTNGLGQPPVTAEATGPLAGSIVVAHSHYRRTSNYFAKVEADFPYELILRPLGSKTISGDWTSGSEVPCEQSRVSWTDHALLLAYKTDRGAFSAERKYFRLWDGKPHYFNSD